MGGWRGQLALKASKRYLRERPVSKLVVVVDFQSLRRVRLFGAPGLQRAWPPCPSPSTPGLPVLHHLRELLSVKLLSCF